jgi:hypothetical protein
MTPISMLLHELPIPFFVRDSMGELIHLAGHVSCPAVELTESVCR